MTPQTNTESLANRFAPAIAGLQEFFGNRGLACGSPQDVYALVERLGADDTFRIEMGSMLRAIIYRQGGTIPRLELLEIVGLAVGGPHVDDAADQIREPAGQLLAFVSDVIHSLRRRLSDDASESETAHPEIATAEAAELEESVVAASQVHEPETGAVDKNEVDTGTVGAGTGATIDVGPGEVGTGEAGTTKIDLRAVGEVTPSELEAASAPLETHERPSREPDQSSIEVAELAPEPAPSEVRPSRIAPVVEDGFELISDSATPVEATVYASGEVYVYTEDRDPIPESAQDAEADVPASPPVFSRVRLSVPAHALAELDEPGPPLQVTVFEVPVADQRADGTALAGYRAPALLSRLTGSYPAAVATALLIALLAALFLHHRVVVQTAQVQKSIPQLAAVANSAISTSSARTRTQTVHTPDFTHSAAGAGSALPAVLTDPPADGTKPGAGVDPDNGAVAPSDLAKDEATSRPGSNTVEANPAKVDLPAADGSVHPGSSEPRPVSGTARLAKGTAPTRVPRSTAGSPSILSSGLLSSNVISSPAPAYPRLAKLAHVQGEVILQAVVSRRGTVVATHVLRGHRLLRGAATRAVRHWRYRPYLVNGKATDVATVVTLDFRLSH